MNRKWHDSVGIGLCALLLTAAGVTRGLAAELHVPVPYATIQAAIDAAQPGDEVIIADGTYTGPGNRDLDFGGKAITVRSANGATNCIIDCETVDRGFRFHSGETPASVVAGLTITRQHYYYAAVQCNDASPTITGCTFTQNGGLDAVSCGGASQPRIVNCVFWDNYGEVGILSAYQGSSPIIEDCVFDNNSGGGGALYLYHSAATVTRCTITAHHSGMEGPGGIYCAGSAVQTFTDCLITDNSGEGAGGALCYGPGRFVRCTFVGNGTRPGAWWYSRGGGANCMDNAQAEFIDCYIAQNNAVDGGSGVSCCRGGAAVLKGCVITGNGADPFAGTGGGVCCAENGTATLINCLVTSNQRGGLVCGGSGDATATLINCTLADNEMPYGGTGGAVTCLGGSVTIANSILWGNLPDSVNVSGGTVSISYSDVEGGWGGAPGNIDLDPLFGSGYTLGAGSPCIDAGDNNAVPPGILTDLAGNLRFVDDPNTQDTGIGTPPIVDMGAFEYAAQCSGDSNCDGEINWRDIDYFVAAMNDNLAAWQAAFAPDLPTCAFMNNDVNGDGTVNWRDIDSLVAVMNTACP